MKNAETSKKGRILRHLQSGRKITALQALRLYGAGRLASTINRLKNEGYDIDKNMIYNLMSEGYAEYFLVITSK